ncbi:ribonuclease HI [Thermodesulfobacteriota bacterium]
MKKQMEANGKMWSRMQFKENKVWAAVDRDGELLVQDGKVLIKYQLKQDYEYWVLKGNIHPIDPNLLKMKKIKRKGSPTHRSEKRKSKSKQGRESDLAPDMETGSRETLEEGSMIQIYADGASSGNPGPSGVGVLLIFGGHQKEISRYIGIATNNIAELQAIRTGLSAVKNKDFPVRVFTDSGYAYGLLELGWKARKNVGLVTSIKNMMEGFRDLQIIKVKGHAGNEGNEKADLLARSSLEKSCKGEIK